eukprot:scaffold93659_cov30-Tisochrysis_lutea.AAC.4
MIKLGPHLSRAPFVSSPLALAPKHVSVALTTPPPPSPDPILSIRRKGHVAPIPTTGVAPSPYGLAAWQESLPLLSRLLAPLRRASH